MSFRKVKVMKDPDCALCGPNPTIKELNLYQEEACEFKAAKCEV
jgi:adenylyltransferase/sulfurtransferase